MSAQSMDALALGNRIRRERKRLKAQVAHREVPLREVLLHPPEFIWSLSIFEVLRWQFRWERHRAQQFLEKLGVPEMATVGPSERPGSTACGRLTKQQRKRVIESL